MDVNHASTIYELKDDLARLCLPAAHHDPDRKLAWVNSICFLFLVIGILGAYRSDVDIPPVPPIQLIIPIVVEPASLPPQPTPEKRVVEEAAPNAPPVAVVLPQTPNINFSVPTIGTLVASASLAAAPPLEPMRVAARINSVGSTGAGGDRPQPVYPTIALQAGEQGTVTLSITGDAIGNVLSVEVKQSSGYPILDRGAVDFVKRHWHLPTGQGNQFFETRITYQLQLN
ncbi:MAG TPA: TonB family protein [Candidatus Acidoferrum sp.]|nr:TonB family protein [Candidatus Acidoferrum sp.]